MGTGGEAMKYVEALTEHHCAGPDLTLFLAGGITNCENWQTEMVGRLSDADLTLLNPRRTVWPKDDPAASEKQIKWEHRHLLRADAILFWFPPQTDCPITLFELGRWVSPPGKIFVGCHPKYSRKIDVEVQVILERPFQKVVDNLDDLAAQVKEWAVKKALDRFHRDQDQPLAKDVSRSGTR
jgi:hypothetical protein